MKSVYIRCHLQRFITNMKGIKGEHGRIITLMVEYNTKDADGKKLV